jgi:hypothetical protein
MRSRKTFLFAAAACALLSMGCSSFFGHFYSHSITFHANDGSGAESVQTAQPNADVTLAKNTFSRTGYSFLGWAPDSAAIQPSYYDEARYFVGVSDEDLYAIWAPASACHTITFKAGTGTGSDGSQIVVQGSSVKLRTVADIGFVAPPELTFGGWASNPDATVPEYTDGQSITMGSSDLVLYAVWGTRQLSVWVEGGNDVVFTPLSNLDSRDVGKAAPSSPRYLLVRLGNTGTIPLSLKSGSITLGAEIPDGTFTLEGKTDGVILGAGESVILVVVLAVPDGYSVGSDVAVDAIFKIRSDSQDDESDGGFTLNLSGTLSSY